MEPYDLPGFAAAHGVHIAHSTDPPDWIVGLEPLEAAEATGELPEISIDPEDFLLSVVNTSPQGKCFYVSLHHSLVDANELPLQAGTTVDGDQVVSECTTLVLTLGPLEVMDVCYIDIESLDELTLASDVVAVAPAEAAGDEHNPEHVLLFPLDGPVGSFLCSQSAIGGMSHFLPQTRHAVDFECAEGTSVLAGGDGEVLQVMQQATVTGIHVSNLHAFNMVQLRLDCGMVVDYVHIRPGSVCVEPGQRVRAGEKICASGQAGFCPTSHLHVQAYATNADDAPSIKFSFLEREGETKATFFAEAGLWY
eukprot:TRINITY_DN14170_c0_g1_i1.p1 TRINITY_DN14170_c0_g1~~TRINITY_DN14170_c0_g1_i1.p1  ORF type:complete len:308 (-),score=77.07 TRINITY_DN14170_c0_g1_i1:11-934(-)